MRSNTGLTTVRTVLSVLAALLVGYLAVIAAWPQLRLHLPPALRWFGQPNSAVTIAIVTGVLVLLCVVLTRAGGGRRSGAPVAIVAGLAVMSALLGIASYWRCQDDSHPDFFTTVAWTANLVKGGNPVQSLESGVCPSPTPVALYVAQLSALAAVFLSVIGVAAALFRSRVDRLRVYFAKSVTAVVGLDEDSRSLIPAITRTAPPHSALAVLTDAPESGWLAEARNQGARVVPVDYAKPESLTSLSLWRKLDTLYLLAADPAANLARLGIVTPAVAESRDRQRIPLIVRIDDPWQASAWRARQFGAAERVWAPDAVGRYEMTARRLADLIEADSGVTRLLICGTSQLTLALCADLAQRQLERDYAERPELPPATLIAEDAADLLDDHVHSRRQLGLPDDRPVLTAVSAKPTVPLMLSLITGDGQDPASVAVVIVDAPGLTGIGTRLAARFPDTAIYAWDATADPGALSAPGMSLVGRLRSYQLSMDVPDGQAHDAWELAARLIHERYAKPGGSPSSLPWPELSEFYRESNRRQVNNALWMVENIGGHTWDAGSGPAQEWSPAALRGLAPLEQLQVMGFEKTSAIAMARAEHQDWCRFYRRHGWTPGSRNEDAKTHPNLVDWSEIEQDPESLNKALSSLAATLSKLRELGYRSRPVSVG